LTYQAEWVAGLKTEWWQLLTAAMGKGRAWSIVSHKRHLQLVPSPMRKVLFCFFLLILIFDGGTVSAQDAAGGYSYEKQYQNRQFALIEQNANRSLRWRPLDEDPAGDSYRRPDTHAGPYPGASDYTDEPLGLPRGTYRAIEKRHTITPHLEGYRFRPIDPNEQLRNRSRNDSQEQSMRGHAASQWDRTTNAPPYGYGPSAQAPVLNYRPDPRLDRNGNTAETPSRYAYPMGSDAPLFRPR
jgi:hypothetical protein